MLFEFCGRFSWSSSCEISTCFFMMELLEVITTAVDADTTLSALTVRGNLAFLCSEITFCAPTDRLLRGVSRVIPNPVSGSTRFLNGLQDSYVSGVGVGVGRLGDEIRVTF